MRRACPKTPGDAWDVAEKAFADRGRPWSVNRRGDKFWIESDDIKVTINDRDERPHFVVNLYLKSQMLSWTCTYPDALEELLAMIDASDHAEHGDEGDR
jgi:hypothetical protein